MSSEGIEDDADQVEEEIANDANQQTDNVYI